MLFQVHVVTQVQDIIVEVDDIREAISVAEGEVGLAAAPGHTYTVTALSEDETQVQFTESNLA